MVSRIRLTAVVVVHLVAVVAARASWPDNPGVNLAIGDRSGEQTQPKIAVRPDGGAYVSWFDNSGGGYDVYLQRLDSDGNELWPHNGVLVADRGFSSTQDYGLDLDADGSALLAFRDDRSGSTQITVAKIAPDGSAAWGPSGIQITRGTDFVAAPKVAGTTDGHVVVAWTNNSDVALLKLDPTGQPVWARVTIAAIGGDGTSASDLVAADAGGVIVSMVRGFLSPKHLHAQKLDTDGNTLWGVVPPAVFDGGALQTGNFPQFVPDGSGGGAFAWYSVGPLQCHGQRVRSDGSEAFPHNGTAVATGPEPRTAPDVSFNPATSETYVFWREERGGPSPEFGVYGQKFDANGVRQWGDTGVEIAPLTTTELTQTRQVAWSDGALVAWVSTLAFGNQTIHAARVDASGALVWKNATDISNVTSSKSRLALAHTSNDNAIMVWADGRNDANDIYGQNVNNDGTLGPAQLIGDMNCDGQVSVGDINPFVLALTDPVAYANQFPDCELLNGDCSDDEQVTVGDINCFVALVTGG